MEIGYKKVKQGDKGNRYQMKNRILKLEILGRVIAPDGRNGKKRTSKARVLEAFSTRQNSLGHDRIDKKLKSEGPYYPYHYFSGPATPGFEYIVGQIAVPSNGLDCNIYDDCGSGINFFSTLEEALSYR